MLLLNRVISGINAYPQNNAFCIQDKFYTYSDLSSNIGHIQGIIKAKCEPEQRIGVLIRDNIETYSAIMAILLSGKTYIPIHPGHPVDRIAQIVEQADLRLILSTIETATYAGITNINITPAGNVPGNPELTIPEENISKKDAYILFTSGSTGVPKGTPISFHNLQSFANAFFALGYELNEQDRFLQMFDLTFDLSVMSYLIPLCIGACVYTVPEKGMKYTNIYGILEKYQITFALMVPSVLFYLKPYFDEITLPQLRYSLFCGEALLRDVVTEWANCVPNAVIENVYGPTEATIFCLRYTVNTHGDVLHGHGIASIGKPMKGTEAIIVNDAHQPLHDLVKGELCLSGHQVTRGYLSEERNKDAFFTLNNKKYYRTGDIACRLEDGNFIYCGRADNQVKIHGFRVELSEVEHHVRNIIKGLNVVALAMDTSQGLNQIEVVIESEEMDTGELLYALKLRLPLYMIPANIHYITTFPLNVNGKTDRKALQQLILAAV